MKRVAQPSVKEKIHSHLIINRASESDDDTVVEEAKDTRTRQYLTDQNKKFNELINKNISYVDHDNKNLSGIYKNWEQVIYLDEGESDEDHRNDTRNDTNDTTNDEFEQYLNTLNLSSKVELYKKVKVDLGLNSNSFDGVELNNELFSKLGLLEKLEIMTILVIKLNFMLLKHSIPISKNIYARFVKNQLFLFNHNNFNRMLNSIIKLMNYIDKKFNASHYQESMAISAASNIEDIERQIENTTIGNEQLASQTSWKSALFSYALNYYGAPQLPTEEVSLLAIAEQFVEQL